MSRTKKVVFIGVPTILIACTLFGLILFAHYQPAVVAADGYDMYWPTQPWPPGEEYCYYDPCNDQWHCRSDLAAIVHVSMQHDMEPIELLDAPEGNSIDLDVEKVPYFPDYTFGGLFPNADRTTWLNVAEAADW